MWYRIDITKLVMQLLPPILRSKLLVALVNVLVLPLSYVYERFCSVKNTVDGRLTITGNVQYLEKALNDAFYLKDHQIFIDTPDEEKVPSFYYASELQEANYLYLQSEDIGFVLMRKGESRVLVNFIVMVPTFLCTSLDDKASDKYGWRYLSEIKRILNIYKPAGRTFSIELYDYE